MGKNTQKNTKKRLCLRTSKFSSVFLFLILLVITAGCTKKEDLIIPQDAAVDASDEFTAEVFSEAGMIASDLLTDSKEQSLFVHVCGAVQTEGLYELPDGSRISDAVQAAGGFLTEADTTYLNLAAKLSDGMQIRIPFMRDEDAQEFSDGTQAGLASGTVAGNGYGASPGLSQALIPSQETAAGSDGAQQGALVNINTATLGELCTLSGIGEAKAGDIIAYRESNGFFKNTEELMNVSGIGEKVYNKIKAFITT